MSELSRIFRECIKTGRMFEKEEREGSISPFNGERAKKWAYYGRPVDAYNCTLGLPKGFLRTHLPKYCKNGHPLRVLDIMADPSFIMSMGASGVAVGLSDRDNIRPRLSAHPHPVYMVEGNIMRRNTWNQVRNCMRGGNIDYFDVVIEDGIGGKNSMTYEPRIIHPLLNRAYRLMDPTDSVMILSALPGQMVTPDVNSFIKMINRCPGLYVDHDMDNFILYRTQGSPDNLPY